MNEWSQIEALTGWVIPESARLGCHAPKVVTIPAGRELYAAGPSTKERMDWGAFEENDIGWYLQGNQLDPTWYLGTRTQRIALYEYVVTLKEPTLAVMSKVAAQSGAPTRAEPIKFQYYRPIGFGKPTRLRLLGYLEVDGSFTPESDRVDEGKGA
jgi:hypothetical protein